MGWASFQSEYMRSKLVPRPPLTLADETCCFCLPGHGYEQGVVQAG